MFYFTINNINNNTNNVSLIVHNSLFRKDYAIEIDLQVSEWDFVDI